MNKWEGLVDRLIAESIGDGDVSHLPGSGKKLPLKDDSATPADMRLAFKIMNDHQVMPEWIERSQRLEKTEAKLISQLQERAKRHQRELQHANQAASAIGAARAESNWRRYQGQFLERVERYNRELLVHNLSLPSGLPHRQILQGTALIQQAMEGESTN